MFRAIITVFAGYWHPSLANRLWVKLFFLTVRLQGRLGFVPPHLPRQAGVDTRSHSEGGVAQSNDVRIR